MFPKSKVTEIYCMTDDFCKEFSFPQEKPYDYKHVPLSHQKLHDERKSLLSYVYNYSFSHFI